MNLNKILAFVCLMKNVLLYFGKKNPSVNPLCVSFITNIQLWFTVWLTNMVVCIMCIILKQCWSVGYVSLLTLSFIQGIKITISGRQKAVTLLRHFFRSSRKPILKIWYFVNNTQEYKICKIQKKIIDRFFLATSVLLYLKLVYCVYFVSVIFFTFGMIYFAVKYNLVCLEN